MKRHCPNCESTQILTTIHAGDNDAWCSFCPWKGLESELEERNDFGDLILEWAKGGQA